MALFASNIITSDSALGSAVIERSLRFNRGTQASLTRSPSSSTDSTKQTLSFWFKVSSLVDATNQGVLFAGGSDGSYSYVQLWSNTFYFGNSAGPYWNGNLTIRDFTSWYHATIVIDTTQGTANDRQKLYINGVQQERGGGTNPSQDANYEFLTNSSWTYYIGKRAANDMNFEGYMAEINFVQGQALEPTQFGFTDPQTGIWLPKRYEGTYGTNGFYLDFSDKSSTAALGIDKSPNGNDFTVNNLGTIHCTKDSPTNNYCNLDPLNSTDTEFSSSNFKGVFGSSNARTALGSIGLKSGKWYYEVYYQSATNDALCIGFANAEYSPTNYSGNVTDAFQKTDNVGYYGAGGGFIYYGVATRTSEFTNEDFTAGDIIGVAADFDKNEIYFYKNGSVVSSANPYSYTFLDKDYLPCIANLTSGGNQIFYVNFGHDSSFDGVKTAQGNTDENGDGDFYYPVPSGFKTICSRNVAPPTSPIITRPQRHFDTLIYTGNGSDDRDVTGLEFKPDFVWIKNRDDYDWHQLVDVIRGANKTLWANTNDGEDTDNSNGHVNHFIEGGFNVTAGASGNTNKDTEDYVAWCWKAGGAAVTNTVGNISAQVSANDEAGFSIITYTGDGNTSGNVGTGLRSTQPLDMAIVKRRNSSSDWQVGHSASGQGVNFAYHMNLNDSTALSGSTPYHMATQSATNGDRLYLAEGGLTSSATYVAYVWQERPGYSKFGSYKGNGSTNGSFVYCGFRPAFLIAKKYSGTDAWIMWDSTRDPDNLMHHRNSAEYYPETTSVDSGSSQCEFLSNGFKWRGTSNDTNGDGDNYVFLAFAEQPGTTSFNTITNAR